MADNKCQYQIKAKYNGVYGYSNDNLTDKKAETLAKEHPLANHLFDLLPSKLQKERDKKESVALKKIEDFRKEKREERDKNKSIAAKKIEDFRKEKKKERDKNKSVALKKTEDFRKEKREEVKKEQNRQKEKLLADAPKRPTVVHLQNKVEEKLAKNRTTKKED